MLISEQTEKDIDMTRGEYVPVAINTQILFFCVSDLANIDPMYQYSLEWFTRIFLNSIQHAGKAGNVNLTLLNYPTFNLLNSVFSLRNDQGPNAQHKRTFHIQLVHKRLPQFVREAQVALCFSAHRENFNEWKQDFNGELTFFFI